MNSCVFVGRLGKKPELKMTNGGKQVCNFSLAVNNPFTKESDWFEFVAWGSAAQYLVQYGDKGDSVCAHGNLTMRKYDDGTNVTTYYNINCDRVEVISRAKSSTSVLRAEEPADAFAGDMKLTQDDDLPF